MIHIIDDYYVDADDRQYIVGKKVTYNQSKVNEETGEKEDVTQEVLQNKKFYTSLSGCIRYLHELYQKREVAGYNGSLKEFVPILDNIRENFQNILDEKLNEELI